jgi:hypothetical protein
MHVMGDDLPALVLYFTTDLVKAKTSTKVRIMNRPPEEILDGGLLVRMNLLMLRMRGSSHSGHDLNLTDLACGSVK